MGKVNTRKWKFRPKDDPFASREQLSLNLYTFTLKLTIRQAHRDLKSSSYEEFIYKK